MNSRVMLLKLFFIFLSSVQAGITITLPEGNTVLGPYRTTRFSHLIGSFSAKCLLSSNATVLLSSEDPCEKNSIAPEVAGMVVFVYSIESKNCYPEESYLNLESLGAIAVVNVAKRPAGSNMYISHFGYPIGKGSIPFLDTSLEFFEDVYEEIKNFDEAVAVEVDECEDKNQFKFCYEVSDVLTSWCLIVFTGLNIYTSRNALKRIKISKETAPRIFILKFFFYQNIYLSASFFFNLTAYDTYFWLTDGKYKTNLGFLFLGVEASLFFFGTLLCGYYWFFCARKCFSNKNLFNIGCLDLFFRFCDDDFFKGSAYYFCYVYSALGFAVIQYYLQRPVGYFEVIPILLMSTDTLVYLIFLFSNTVFLSNVVKVLKQTGIKDSSMTQISLCTRLTGMGLGAYLDKQNFGTEHFSFKTCRLVVHLNKWLFRFMGIYCIILACGVFKDKFYFYGDEEDSIALKYCLMSVFKLGIYIPRLLMEFCLIKGVSGLSPKKSDNDNVKHFINTN
eukprot:snap_masked-scaffold_13-processed-gene-11.39-mRNA-1 protein AED:1.00 eAED:1.00 QI:0/-1/0/0/-1/1/1/0/503